MMVVAQLEVVNDAFADRVLVLTNVDNHLILMLFADLILWDWLSASMNNKTNE